MDQPFGLINSCARCYFNTAMQALYTPFLFIALIKDESAASKPYTKFITNFRPIDSYVRKLFYDPAYSKFNETYRENVCDSSFDCFHCIVEQLSYETKNIDILFNLTKNVEFSCKNCSVETFSNKVDIIFPLKINKTDFIKYLIDDSFQEFFAKIDETLDTKCKGCGNNSIIRTEYVTTFPRLLVVKFTDHTYKITPETSNLIVIPFNVKINGTTYEYYPISLIYHTSGIPGHSGHYHGIYLRYKKTDTIKSSKYYSIDDSIVSEVPKSSLRITQGLEYIIYQRIDPPN